MRQGWENNWCGATCCTTFAFLKCKLCPTTTTIFWLQWQDLGTRQNDKCPAWGPDGRLLLLEWILMSSLTLDLVCKHHSPDALWKRCFIQIIKDGYCVCHLFTISYKSFLPGMATRGLQKLGCPGSRGLDHCKAFAVTYSIKCWNTASIILERINGLPGSCWCHNMLNNCHNS